TSQQTNELVVEVYDTTTIQERTGISQGGFILMALLLQNDISKGISGIGARTAYGLAQCGFGDSILDAAFQYPAATIPTAFKEINNQMATEIKLNSHGKIGSCSPARSHKLRTSEFPSLQDLTEIKAFARPPTLSDIPTYLPKLPDIEGIASFCREYFAWSSELTFKKFHASLWPAVIVQMLCSQFVAYNSLKAEFLVPTMEPIPEHLKFDSRGNPFIPTYGVSVLNKHPLDVEGKNRLHTISVDFGTTTFIQLAGLSDLANTSTTKRRLKIHSIVIAYARKNEYNNSL
ncbi:hypothetical protein EV360DRAFT_77357, partial [Lentinula raphanica]